MFAKSRSQNVNFWLQKSSQKNLKKFLKKVQKTVDNTIKVLYYM